MMTVLQVVLQSPRMLSTNTLTSPYAGLLSVVGL